MVTGQNQAIPAHAKAGHYWMPPMLSTAMPVAVSIP